MRGSPVRAVWLDTPLELCLERNACREGRVRVPPAWLFGTGARLAPPSTEEGFHRVDVVGHAGRRPAPPPGTV